MAGDGSLTVLAYDGSVPPGPAAVPLEVWQYDPVTLHRLLKRDFLGWGYTVPLVWPDLPHNLRSVRVKVCYQPAQGSPMYTEGDSMTIEFPGSEGDGRVYTQSANRARIEPFSRDGQRRLAQRATRSRPFGGAGLGGLAGGANFWSSKDIVPPTASAGRALGGRTLAGHAAVERPSAPQRALFPTPTAGASRLTEPHPPDRISDEWH